MSHESIATRRLREQAEHAIATAQSRKVVEPLLERLVSLAAPGSDAALLAHRYLAEYRLEDHPWRALLHLKHVLSAHPEDDVAHAMCGLAHAMSGNYRSAVTSYRAAAQAAAENPWYHHNLGHLLDVALDRPATALPHLRIAFELLGQDEPEVSASLIHCLSRMGPAMHERALSVLASARRRHPKHVSLHDLALKLGLPDEPAPRRAPSPRAARPIPLRPRVAPTLVTGETASVHAVRSERSSHAVAAEVPAPIGRRHAASKPAKDLAANDRSSASAPREDAVVAALRERLGTLPGPFDAAKLLWDRYSEAHPKVRRGRQRTVHVVAAALHRIVMRKSRGGEVTLESIAQAYGVDPAAVEARTAEIERSLGW
ncbi:MAG: hypothetical protein J0L92_25995 [Deltaproteobacteria bacterium]|nr:hypothetical protein [Deltaproteobacteria bacterium]